MTFTMVEKSETTPTITTDSPHPDSALLDRVENRTHSGGNISVDPSLLQSPIGEAPIGFSSVGNEEDIFAAEIAKAKLEKGQQNGKTTESKTGSTNSRPSSSNFENPGLKSLSPEQKQSAAASLAKMIVEGYARLNNFADSRLQISKKTMLKIRSAGKIDMEVPIPIDQGTVTFEEFVNIYNEQTRGTINVDDEFREDVLPRLTNVLAKRGQGLSDEQYLLGAFAMHAGVNFQKFIAQKQTLRAFMDFGIQITNAHRDVATISPGNSNLSDTRPSGNDPLAQSAVPGTPPAGGSPSNLNMNTVPPASGPGAHAQYMDHPNAELYAAGSATNYQLREWGGADMKALSRATSRKKKTNKVSPSTISAEKPPVRKRIRKTSSEK